MCSCQQYAAPVVHEQPKLMPLVGLDAHRARPYRYGSRPSLCPLCLCGSIVPSLYLCSTLSPGCAIIAHVAGPATSPRYPIPAAESRVETRASNSRFIATAGYTPTVADARALIARVRDEFPDASHHVYAYVVGYGASVTAGMSDDGEPGGTAGRPALAVLRGSGLGDTCVVVTRYFGGTLLGTGGLVHAYGAAVKAVLAELPRDEKVERSMLTLTAPYALYETTRRLVEDHGALLVDQTFGVDVQLQLQIDADHVDTFVDALVEQTAGNVTVRKDI
jgi:uncharacterized YigZ family protein